MKQNQPSRSCEHCGNLPAQIIHRWDDLRDPEPQFPASAKALQRVVGWRYGGRGEELLQCASCQAFFRWYANFEIMPSGCDSEELLERIHPEAAERLRQQLDQIKR